MKGPKIHPDTFGMELQQTYKNGYGCHISEQDDGTINCGDGKEYFSSYPEWESSVQEAIGYAKGKLLDVGCGAGRHSLYLQSKGFDCLGIDVSRSAIQLCKEQGLRKAQVASIEEVETLTGLFDTLLMLGYNLGLLQSPQKATVLLQKLARATAPGGIIIGDTLDPMHPQAVAADEHYHAWNRERGRPMGSVTLRSRYRHYAGEWFDYWFMSKSELKAVIKDTPWILEHYIDEPNSPAYVVILKNHAG